MDFDSGLDLEGTDGAFFGELAMGLALDEMAGFPGFSTLLLFGGVFGAAFGAGFAVAFAAGLAAGLGAAFTEGLPAGLATFTAFVAALAAALGCAPCGFFGGMVFLGLATGMEPPVNGMFLTIYRLPVNKKYVAGPTAARRIGNRNFRNGRVEKAHHPRARAQGKQAISGKLFGRTFGVQSLRKFRGGGGRLLCEFPLI
ncbi:hypothetical protein [Polaromonas sp. YR568]|uniref:hypothetical protein n=1 Tax=Polaromonas sp. YR568 TaxID=1855301 RepID=UPI00313819E3